MNEIITVEEVRRLVNQNILSYEQAALVFDISVMGVYQKFLRLKRGELRRTELNEAERQRLTNFTQEFESFINNLKNRLESEEAK